MFGLGPWELIIILFIVVIVFGVGKLPELGTGLGEGIKNFKKSYREAKTLDVTEDSLRTGESSRSGEKQPSANKPEETSS